MSKTSGAARQFGNRSSSSSRALLRRKAAEQAGPRLSNEEALEDSFPAPAQEPDADRLPDEPGSASLEPGSAARAEAVRLPSTIGHAVLGGGTEGVSGADRRTALPPPQTPSHQPPLWTTDDEDQLTALIAKRKAVGLRRWGKSVSGQRVTSGPVAPNPNTVTAAIVSLVIDQGIIGRADLIKQMANAVFPHPCARPQDRGWCQGYVAGAIRAGFLALVSEAGEGASPASSNEER